MSSYELLRPLLFCIEPERAHRVAMSLYGWRSRFAPRREQQESAVTVGPLRFKNRLGLAAGFDKNGAYIDLAAHMGFGFVEIGTMTPRPQAGNPRPRIFRYPEAKALVNRMGFPNDGVDAISTRAERSVSALTKGANISKNFDTPLSSAIEDFVTCFRRARRWADYIVINVSSPNTPGLRELQSAEFLAQVCSAFRKEELEFPIAGLRAQPLLLKISPDLTELQLQEIADFVKGSHLAGVIATNTTNDREGGNAQFTETGGVSGAPLFTRSLSYVRYLRHRLGPDALIIGCGGIMSAENASQMRDAGADVLQIYTGLIYRGPKLVKEIVAAAG